MNWNKFLPYSRSNKHVWHTFFSLEHVWQTSVFLNLMRAPGHHLNTVKGRAHILHSFPYFSFIWSVKSNKWDILLERCLVSLRFLRTYYSHFLKMFCIFNIDGKFVDIFLFYYTITNFSRMRSNNWIYIWLQGKKSLITWIHDKIWLCKLLPFECKDYLQGMFDTKLEIPGKIFEKKNINKDAWWLTISS